MIRHFFDTSALVKIYHREAGSDFCLARYADQSPLIISELARVELHSAIYRKQRDKELSAKALNKLIDRLPENATWDDLMHEIYVREAIERGLVDSRAGRTTSVREVRAKYGLPSPTSNLIRSMCLP